MHRKKLSGEERRTIRKRYEGGESVDRITKAMIADGRSVSRGTIYRALTEGGTRIRSYEEARKLRWGRLSVAERRAEMEPAFRVMQERAAAGLLYHHDLDISALARRYETGISLSQLARETGLSYKPIKTRLERHGVKIRSRDEARSMRGRRQREAHHASQQQESQI